MRSLNKPIYKYNTLNHLRVIEQGVIYTETNVNKENTHPAKPFSL